jgi:hypothetical protein
MGLFNSPVKYPTFSVRHTCRKKALSVKITRFWGCPNRGKRVEITTDFIFRIKLTNVPGFWEKRSRMFAHREHWSGILG